MSSPLSTSAQTAYGLQWNNGGGKVSLQQLNLETGQSVVVRESLEIGSDEVVANTMYVQENQGVAYFHTVNNQTANRTLRIASIKTGEIVRNIGLQGSMAPFVLPEDGKVGFITTDRTFNGYGNNEEDNSLVIFDMGKGRMAHRIPLPQLSFSAVDAPFVGTTTTNRNIESGSKNVAISSTCRVPGTSQIIFAATDVTNTNRVFVVDAAKGEMVKSIAVEETFMDFEFDEETGDLFGLFIESANGTTCLKIGKLDAEYNIVESSTVRVLTYADQKSKIIDQFSGTAEGIFDGAIKVQNGKCYVLKSSGSLSAMYVYSAEDLTLLTTTTSPNKLDFEFPKTDIVTSSPNLNDAISVYPNPSRSGADINVSTEADQSIQRVVVRSITGQTIKVIDVQGMQSNVQINLGELAAGSYYFDVESTGAALITKKVMIH